VTTKYRLAVWFKRNAPRAASILAALTIVGSAPAWSMAFMIGPADQVLPLLQATLTPIDFPPVYQGFAIISVQQQECEPGDRSTVAWVSVVTQNSGGPFPRICAATREDGVSRTAAAMDFYLRQIVASVVSVYGADAAERAVTNIYGFAVAPSSSGGNAEIIGSVAIPGMMDDPLFGLTYSPGQVHFETAPASIAQKCPGLSGRQLWAYAKWEGPTRLYWIVSGFVGVTPDGPGNGPGYLEPDSIGVVVEFRGSECRLSTPEMVLSGKSGRSKKKRSVEITEEALNGLASDALRRYSAAFGGKAQFLQEVTRQRVNRAKLPPVLRSHLKRSRT
jgi:hypothetical protein